MSLDDKASFRLREEEVKNIEQAISVHPNKYKNTSHFLRCAIIRQLREDGVIL